MTNTELFDYYANTLPAQYREQPNAYATIALLAYLALLPQDGGPIYDLDGNIIIDIDLTPVTSLDPNARPILPLAITEAFDIDTAVGQQLDFIAEAIGAKRSGYNLLGQWVTLDEDDYRILLKAVSSRNYLVATTPNIVKFITSFFSGILTVKDDKNMHMTFLYLATLGTVPWAELFITQGFLPRPLAVGISIANINPYPGVLFYGFRTALSPAPSYVSPVSTISDPLTGHVLTASDFIPV